MGPSKLSFDPDLLSRLESPVQDGGGLIPRVHLGPRVIPTGTVSPKPDEEGLLRDTGRTGSTGPESGQRTGQTPRRPPSPTCVVTGDDRGKSPALRSGRLAINRTTNTRLNPYINDALRLGRAPYVKLPMVSLDATG